MVKKFPHLFLVLLIEGGALMAVELMGAKLVAPFYGNSLFVWTAVLTITVLGLTLGYYTGGRLAKKGASERTLFVVLQISAVLVLALPMTASIAIGLTKGMDLIAGICVTCILVLLPPMLCFGIVGPMVVSLMSSRLETVGKTAGTVYFTSTLAGIVATFFFGLYFIPVAGLRWCAIVTGLALAALPVVYIVKRAFGRGLQRFLDSARNDNLKGRPGSSAFAKLRRDKPTPATDVGIGDAGFKEWRSPAPAGTSDGRDHLSFRKEHGEGLRKTRHLPVCRARRRDGDGRRADVRANGRAVLWFIALRLGNGHRLHAAGAGDRLFFRWRHRRQIQRL